MPRFHAHRGDRLRRFVIPWVFALISLSIVTTFLSLGRILDQEDPLEQADVIFVLGGTHLDRAAEAGHLYLEGRAPRILLSGQSPDAAEMALLARGLKIVSVAQIQVDTLMQMGVPAAAIDVVGASEDNTAGESFELRKQFAAKHWSRIIVVTSRLHTARARLALHRHFGGSGARIIMRVTRYDETDVDRWWTNRRDLRFGLFEAQKLLAYWIGAAD